MARSLRKVATLGPAYGSYFQSEVVPVLRSGFIPPISQGFERFLANPTTREAFEKFADAQTTGDRVGAFDTHPPFADRIAALGVSLTGVADHEPEPGSALMPEPDEHARTLLEHELGSETLNQLKPIAWESVAEHVYVGSWTRLAQEYRAWFGTLTTEGIPSGKRPYIEMGSRLVGREEVNVNSEERIDRAVQLMTAGLGATLVKAGWRLETGPGQPLVLVRGTERLNPRERIVRLVQQPESYLEWRALCETVGIAGLPLAAQEAVGA